LIEFAVFEAHVHPCLLQELPGFLIQVVLVEFLDLVVPLA
jgi:hypothetical protein